jgi:Xaa-Pro dipeptidase
MQRRNFLQLSTLAGSGLVAGLSSCASKETESDKLMGLASMSKEAQPITLAERESRIVKAQTLLLENKMGALILDCGTSMNYFTGVRWWPSERTLLAIIPAKGAVTYVCPAFEKDRLQEQVTIGKDIYVWEEDESPFALVASILKDLGLSSGNIGLEEQVRFFIADGLRKAAPAFDFVSGDPISIPCRIVKSAAEIKLMQIANNITLAAIKYGVSQLKEGMQQHELSALIMEAQNQLGGDADFALCLFGKASAFPHGTKEPYQLKKGDMVLMDCGCSVQGYKSDITRTVVFGEPSKRQRDIWNLEKEAQAAGFKAAKIGATGDAVDAAARKVITDAGFGPGYKLPGLPHRTGHGIGMDGHEWGNMVKGNTALLVPGMCFSIEPTIAIPGEFGIRFEDCVYMTEKGPQWFTQPGKSIEEPFG